MSHYPPEDVYDDGEYRKANVPTNKRTNSLLIRPTLGSVKTTTYKLPDASFVYGLPNISNGEGVRDLVNSWQEHQRNPDPVPGRDFKKFNKHAVSSGATTSKTISTFRKESGLDFRLKHRETRHLLHSSKPDHITNTSNTFGRASIPTPIGDVINNSQHREYIIQQRINRIDEEVRARQLQQKLNQPPAQTRASLGHQKVLNTEIKVPFKMSRFANVPNKVTTFRGTSSQSKLSSVQQTSSQSQTIEVDVPTQAYSPAQTANSSAEILSFPDAVESH